MIIFDIPGDASGNPDPITLPSTAGGKRRLRIRPPAGHAWTQYDNDGNHSPHDIDEIGEIMRHPAEAAFVGLETVGSLALDTGSGTFKGILD